MNALHRCNRVIRKVRKTQHQTLILVIHRWDYKKKLAKKYISIQRGMELRKPSILVVNCVSSCLTFFLSTSTSATYIFTAPNCTTTIIILEPCALNAEYEHFILRFIKMSLLCRYFVKEGIGGWKEAQRQGEDRVTLRITLISRPILEE